MKNLLLLSSIILFSVLSSCADTESKEGINPDAETTTENITNTTAASAAVETEIQPSVIEIQNNVPDASNLRGVKVKMTTSKGDIVLSLYDETPGHRDNFVKLVKENFYDGLLFHRVMQDFMIQAGDPLSKGAAAGVQLGSGGPGYTVPAEIKTNLIHKKGALCAARTGPGNPLKNSSGSQFYIVTGRVMDKAQLEQMSAQQMAMVEQQAIGAFLQEPENKWYMDQVDGWNKEYQTDPTPQNQAVIQKKYDAMIAEIQPLIASDLPQVGYSEEQMEIYATIGGRPDLDKEYTVFGEVLEGIEIVEEIQLVPTTSDRPDEDVTILKMEILD
ncbi:MAG: cyclophilin family peptidyl-prolyl cis-trans isomerase [Parvicella sp.]|jgi:cyclophilin family peptidyl-prolyl cis-trans isomerase